MNSAKDLGDGELCPYPVEDQSSPHGRMYKLSGGAQWCAHSDHHRTADQKSAEQGAREMANTDPGATPAPKPSRAAKPEAIKSKPARAAVAAKPRATAVPKEAKDCLCGCGGQTKGGNFIPGHDARFHSRVRALEAQGLDHTEASTIASQGPLTGKYLAAAEAAKKASKAKPAAE